MAQNNGIMVGFGKGLASAILGTFAFVFSYVAFWISDFVMLAKKGEPITLDGEVVTITGDQLTQFASAMSAVTIVFSVIAVLFTIIGLVLGISAIKTFFRQKNAGKRKPIPALITGIEGAVSSASSIVIVLCAIGLLMI